MKYRTTRKEVTNGYYYRLEVGYCDLQHLLNFENPVAYTCGTYGWNADVYQVWDNFAIVTGYRPFGNIKSKYDRNMEFDKRAEQIAYDYKRDYDERRAEMRKLLEELCDSYIADVKGA